MKESSSDGGSTATACASHRFTGSSSSSSSSSPFVVIRQKTRRRSFGHGTRATRPFRSRRSTSLVTPGVCSIIRSPIVRVGKPSGPAPRSIRRTLYCCGVMPCGSMTCARLRFMASAVRNRPSVASCSRERNLSGGFRSPCISQSIYRLDVGQANGDARTPIAANGAFLSFLAIGVALDLSDLRGRPFYGRPVY